MGNVSPLPDKGVADTDSFDELLESPQYERLRARLVRIFAGRGCRVPEDLADETIARVAAQLRTLAPDYEGDPTRFFYGVARNVYFEHVREPVWTPLDNEPPADDERSGAEGEGLALECLDECLKGLADADRALITDYYRHDRSAKIDHRRRLIALSGGGANALRLRVHRIRRQLARCVESCVSRDRLL